MRKDDTVVGAEEVVAETPDVKAKVQAQVSRDTEEIQKRVPLLAKQYIDNNSWIGLLSTLAYLFVGAFKRYLRTFGDQYEPLKAKVFAAMDGNSYQTTIQSDINSRHNQLLDTLKDSLKSAFLDRRADDLEYEVTKNHYEARRGPLAEKLARIRVAFAGDENASIPLPKTGWINMATDFGLMMGFTILILLVETLAGGYDMWEHMTTDRMALGLTVATIVIPTALGFFAASLWKRYLTNIQAHRTFRRLYGRGDTTKYLVDEFPLADKIAAWISLVSLIVISGLLIGYRVWVVLYQQFDVVGLVAAIAIAVVVFGYTLAKYIFSAPYSAEQYDELRAAMEELQPIDDEIKNIPDPMETFASKVTEAKKNYKDGMEQVMADAQSDVDELNDSRLKLLDLLHERAEAYEAYFTEYRDSANELIRRIVAVHRLDGNTIPFGAANDAEVLGLFTNAVANNEDTQLVEDLRKFEFNAILTDPTLEDAQIEAVTSEMRAVLGIRQIGTPAAAPAAVK